MKQNQILTLAFFIVTNFIFGFIVLIIGVFCNNERAKQIIANVINFFWWIGDINFYKDIGLYFFIFVICMQILFTFWALGKIIEENIKNLYGSKDYEN